MVYEIARYFSEPARRAAARALYCASVSYFGDVMNRDVFGYCPIGIMGLVDGIDFGSRAPGAYTVEDGFDEPRYLSTGGSKPVYWAAKRFATDWDNGLITDLYEALDVRRLVS